MRLATASSKACLSVGIHALFLTLLWGTLTAAPLKAADRTEEHSDLSSRGVASGPKYPLYEFAGALNNTVSAVNRATVVMCANTHPTDSVEIELVLYQYNATSSYNGTVTVDPLETVTFESSSVEFYAADVVMGAGFVEQGLGQIRTSHRSVICTVQTVDPDNIPPTWSFDLPLYRVPLPPDELFQDRFQTTP
jgi:hypothetical protein